MASILKVSGIDHVYGHGRRAHVALKGVGFDLRQGTTLGIVGESGSGKSTLGAIAGGLLRPTRGLIEYAGQEVTGRRGPVWDAYRQGVQFVFQNPLASMNPTFTVEQVLREPLRVARPGMDGAQVARLVRERLSMVELPQGCLGKRPRELSGGQCQRVAIARALMLDARVIICDECTSALDLLVQAQVLNLLRDLQDELGCAYLFIGHDIAVVRHMATDIMVLRAGAVVEQGPAAEVLARPADPYTTMLLEAAR